MTSFHCTMSTIHGPKPQNGMYMRYTSPDLPHEYRAHGVSVPTCIGWTQYHSRTFCGRKQDILKHRNMFQTMVTTIKRLIIALLWFRLLKFVVYHDLSAVVVNYTHYIQTSWQRQRPLCTGGPTPTNIYWRWMSRHLLRSLFTSWPIFKKNT